MKTPLFRAARRSWRRGVAAASILWLGLGALSTPSPLSPGEAAAAQRRLTAAYIYDRNGLALADRDAESLDQLLYSFALIEDGAVTGRHWKGIRTFRQYVARHPHILPVVAIGGWGADGFSQAAATREGRERFVQSTLQLMEENGFLGVDLDWEYPGSSVAGIASSASDGDNLLLLLRELRAGLDELTARDGKARRLSIALGAPASQVTKMDCAAIGALVDQVNVMTYDLHTNRVASHHTALYGGTDANPASVDAAVRLFARAGIPREKMMIGAALFGRVYTLASPDGDPLFAKAKDSGSKSLPYARLKERLQTAEVFFDEEAQAPYAVDGSAFYTYDSPASILAKGAYAVQNGLMGLMCWEYGGDAEGELLAAMRKSLE